MNILYELRALELLKKLNTIKNAKDFGKEFTKEIVNIFPAKVCWICIINPETNKLGVKKLAYAKDRNKDAYIHEIIERIFVIGKDFLTNAYDMADTLDYFESVSKDDIILEPVIYRNNLMGYFAIIGNDKDFNANFANLAGMIAESVNTRLEVLFLYGLMEKTNTEKINFLAGISHEYKTPLNAIIGFSDLLKARLINTNSFKYADIINRSSLYLLTLIQDILDVSRSETQNIEIKYETFRTAKVIEDIIFSFDEIRKSKNIEIKYTLTDVEVNADFIRFKQLIYNFVSNAIKFSRENGKITIVTYVDENGHFVFEVKDQGEGISKKDFGKIFGFFSQVSKNQYKRQQGSGIGLALCKKIVEAHNGKIGFKSRLHYGSTFWFTIPK